MREYLKWSLGKWLDDRFRWRAQYVCGIFAQFGGNQVETSSEINANETMSALNVLCSVFVLILGGYKIFDSADWVGAQNAAQAVEWNAQPQI